MDLKRIFLIGYIGSGKTTIGKMLAARLEFNFVDMDAYIEEKQFKSVSQIFVEQGEEKFRLLEQKYLHEVTKFEQTVIATSRGIPCFFDNMNLMNACGLTVYLRLTPIELAVRLGPDHINKKTLLTDRTGDELLQLIADGLTMREPYYAQADVSVNGSEEEIVSQIRDYISKV